MPRLSAKHQVTIPVSVLDEVGMAPGDEVVISAGDGEIVIRPGEAAFDGAFGALTGAYPPGYLERLDAEDAQR
jgi:AbrB family looped-hinge helix DNA binding protein